MSIEVLEQLAACSDPRRVARLLAEQPEAIQTSFANNDIAAVQSSILERATGDTFLAVQANEVMVTHLN